MAKTKYEAGKSHLSDRIICFFFHFWYVAKAHYLPPKPLIDTRNKLSRHLNIVFYMHTACIPLLVSLGILIACITHFLFTRFSTYNLNLRLVIAYCLQFAKCFQLSTRGCCYPRNYRLPFWKWTSNVHIVWLSSGKTMQGFNKITNHDTHAISAHTFSCSCSMKIAKSGCSFYVPNSIWMAWLHTYDTMWWQFAYTHVKHAQPAMC